MLYRNWALALALLSFPASLIIKLLLAGMVWAARGGEVNTFNNHSPLAVVSWALVSALLPATVPIRRLSNVPPSGVNSVAVSLGGCRSALVSLKNSGSKVSILVPLMVIRLAGAILPVPAATTTFPPQRRVTLRAVVVGKFTHSSTAR